MGRPLHVAHPRRVTWVQAIKPHQIGGVRFMWDNIVESLDALDSGPGLGCILAHAMGLGKTLQTVAFVSTFVRQTGNPRRRVLILVPVNTLENWVDEFKMWAPPPDDVKLWPVNDQCKTWKARHNMITRWSAEGGVLLMGSVPCPFPLCLFGLLFFFFPPALSVVPPRQRRCVGVWAVVRIGEDGCGWLRRKRGQSAGFVVKGNRRGWGRLCCPHNTPITRPVD